MGYILKLAQASMALTILTLVWFGLIFDKAKFASESFCAYLLAAWWFIVICSAYYRKRDK